MSPKVELGRAFIHDESERRSWNDDRRVWNVMGDWEYKAKLLAGIPGAIKREHGWGYYIPIESMTPELRQQIIAPVYADPIPGLEFEVNREALQGNGIFIRATTRRESLGNQPIELIIHPNAIIVNGEIQVNRVWLRLSCEYARDENGIWKGKDRYTRRTNGYDDPPRKAVQKAIEEAGSIVASYLAQHESTLEDARIVRVRDDIDRLERDASKLQEQLNELDKQLVFKRLELNQLQKVTP